MEAFFQVLISVVFGSITIYQSNVLVRNFRNYVTVTRRQPIDVSHQQWPFPPEAESTVGYLTLLGFERLGETQIQLKGFQENSKTWLFVNHDKTVFAELVTLPIGVAVQFNTIFYDDAVLETAYPIGEKIDRPDYRSRRVVTSLDDTWQSHQENAFELSTEHGSPRPIKTISEVLIIEAMYRQRHFRRKLRPILYRDLLVVLYSANLSVLLFGLTFDYFSDPILYTLMAFTFFGAFPVRHVLNYSMPPDPHQSLY